MQMKNLIQASANVIKITSVTKGDVLKMIDETSYSGPEVFYGVVIDILNNGDKCYLQVLRYKKGYQTIEAEIKTYNGVTELNIFPATTEEVQSHLSECIESIKKKIEDDEKTLSSKKLALDMAISFVEGKQSKMLKSVGYEVVEPQRRVEE